MEPSTTKIERTFIFQNGQATIGDLRIGAAEFGTETYTTQDNITQSGLTCSLWFFVRNHEELDRSERVYPGKTVEIAGYQVTVDGIETETDQRAKVFLTITLP